MDLRTQHVYKGEFHSLGIYGENQVEICRKCHPSMDKNQVYSIISICQNDLPHRITKNEMYLTTSINKYMGVLRKSWTFNEVENIMKDNRYIRYTKHGNPFSIGLISKREFELIDIDPNLLHYARSKNNGLEYEFIFIDEHARNGFYIQMNQVRVCMEILYNDWNVCDRNDKYLASFKTLEEAERYAVGRGIKPIIYRDSRIYRGLMDRIRLRRYYIHPTVINEANYFVD